MRRYMLASTESRNDVDLREYSNIIIEAVHDVIKTARVEVSQGYYLVSPTPNQSEAVRIGRQICQSKLRKHCVMIPKLFTSEEIEEVTDDGENGKTSEHPNGGHH